MSIFRRLQGIIANIVDVRKKNLSINTYIQDDLGLDEDDLAELVLAIEEEFDINLPKNIFTEFNTIGEIIGFIEAEMGR
ncbi:MAG: phosphopantetheine-binding protein [Candidatus Thorarchaeota archaeon]